MPRRRLILAGIILLFGTHSLAQKATDKVSALPEVIIYASDLTKSALSEFSFWDEATSPGGKMAGTPNHGDELDPPPENDPHVTFIAKRCSLSVLDSHEGGNAEGQVAGEQILGAILRRGGQVRQGGFEATHGQLSDGTRANATGLGMGEL